MVKDEKYSEQAEQAERWSEIGRVIGNVMANLRRRRIDGIVKGSGVAPIEKYVLDQRVIIYIPLLATHSRIPSNSRRRKVS